MLDKLKKVTLTEQAADIIRDSIISGKFKPGQRLNEIKIATEMGVSRLPVREALRLLQQESLVDSIPNKGVFVATLSFHDIQEIFTLRAVIEGLAIKLAVNYITDEEIDELQDVYAEMVQAASVSDDIQLIRLDLEFHRLIAKFSRHSYVYRIFNYIRGLVLMYLLYDTEVLKADNRLVDSQKEHQIIINALRNRDLDLAVKSLSSHIEQSGLNIMHYLHKQDMTSPDDMPSS
jgi:DNA-binding GntR family transcriptional regulator